MSNIQNEYIIINKTAIQKRIEELTKEKEKFNKFIDKIEYNVLNSLIKQLEQILYQSTPLIPEIDKAYEAGTLDHELSLSFDYPKSRYISNLKLDI